MDMDKFNSDWWPLKWFREQYEYGNINLQPEYQRSRVWTDEQRFGLIDSITQGFPIGLVMLNEIEHIEDDTPIKRYDVVDGQQRVRTILEYLTSSEPWAKLQSRDGFVPFSRLKPAQQQVVLGYKVAIAVMTKFDDDEINEIFSRLQEGKALKPGEKLKAMTTAKVYSSIKEVTEHKIFDLGQGRLKARNSHWMLASAFFKASYTGDLFARIEYINLQKFIRDAKADAFRNRRTLDAVRRTLNYEFNVVREAVEIWPEFSGTTQTARALKWLYITISSLMESYAISGKERDVARGVVDYYKSIAVERSPEWQEYLNTGRTGRVDTEAVKACVAELTNRVLNSTRAEPLDLKRNFTQSQRKQILENAGSKCEICGAELSFSNFHADHKKAHSKGGKTTVENGRALCSACNRTVGNRWREEFKLPHLVQ